MLKVIMMSVFALALTGCAGKERVVEKTTTTFITLDDSWIQDCPTVPPPDKLVYIKATLQQRVDMLSATYMEQARINAQCRIASREARLYNQKQRDKPDVLICKENHCE